MIKKYKKNVALIYGGNSTEHEISIRSARNIAKAMDSSLFETQRVILSGHKALKLEH